MISLRNPFERILALACEIEVDVFDLPADTCGHGFAGAVAVGIDEKNQLRGLVGLADDLDNDLKADTLAFGIAVFAGEPDRIMATAGASLGIGRERQPAASKGPGHLAWHMLYSCGRISPSATFALVDLDTESPETESAA
ncbi:hypothetical protein ACFQV2_12750 [Actinokineospora soli]|uniref:Uncharacterized protein n=1 Tax=Actinokineospora soli TaxID=1048753 RepID=A0ABW2TM75_9PSEU